MQQRLLAAARALVLLSSAFLLRGDSALPACVDASDRSSAGRRAQNKRRVDTDTEPANNGNERQRRRVDAKNSEPVNNGNGRQSRVRQREEEVTPDDDDADVEGTKHRRKRRKQRGESVAVAAPAAGGGSSSTAGSVSEAAPTPSAPPTTSGRAARAQRPSRRDNANVTPARPRQSAPSVAPERIQQTVPSAAPQQAAKTPRPRLRAPIAPVAQPTVPASCANNADANDANAAQQEPEQAQTPTLVRTPSARAVIDQGRNALERSRSALESNRDTVARLLNVVPGGGFIRGLLTRTNSNDATRQRTPRGDGKDATCCICLEEIIPKKESHAMAAKCSLCNRVVSHLECWEEAELVPWENNKRSSWLNRLLEQKVAAKCVLCNQVVWGAQDGNNAAAEVDEKMQHAVVGRVCGRHGETRVQGEGDGVWLDEMHVIDSDIVRRTRDKRMRKLLQKKRRDKLRSLFHRGTPVYLLFFMLTSLFSAFIVNCYIFGWYRADAIGRSDASQFCMLGNNSSFATSADVANSTSGDSTPDLVQQTCSIQNVTCGHATRMAAHLDDVYFSPSFLDPRRYLHRPSEHYLFEAPSVSGFKEFRREQTNFLFANESTDDTTNYVFSSPALCRFFTSLAFLSASLRIPDSARRLKKFSKKFLWGNTDQELILSLASRESGSRLAQAVFALTLGVVQFIALTFVLPALYTLVTGGAEFDLDTLGIETLLSLFDGKFREFYIDLPIANSFTLRCLLVRCINWDPHTWPVLFRAADTLHACESALPVSLLGLLFHPLGRSLSHIAAAVAMAQQWYTDRRNVQIEAAAAAARAQRVGQEADVAIFRANWEAEERRREAEQANGGAERRLEERRVIEQNNLAREQWDAMVRNFDADRGFGLIQLRPGVVVLGFLRWGGVVASAVLAVLGVGFVALWERLPIWIRIALGGVLVIDLTVRLWTASWFLIGTFHDTLGFAGEGVASAMGLPADIVTVTNMWTLWFAYKLSAWVYSYASRAAAAHYAGR